MTSLTVLKTLEYDRGGVLVSVLAIVIRPACSGSYVVSIHLCVHSNVLFLVCRFMCVDSHVKIAFTLYSNKVSHKKISYYELFHLIGFI